MVPEQAILPVCKNEIYKIVSLAETFLFCSDWSVLWKLFISYVDNFQNSINDWECSFVSINGNHISLEQTKVLFDFEHRYHNKQQYEGQWDSMLTEYIQMLFKKYWSTAYWRPGVRMKSCAWLELDTRARAYCRFCYARCNKDRTLPDNCNGDSIVPFKILFNLFEFILPSTQWQSKDPYFCCWIRVW